MTHPTCKTCKQWTPPPVYLGLHEGDCALLIDDGSFHMDRVTLHDVDGSSVSFGPDFGCIHHEERE